MMNKEHLKAMVKKAEGEAQEKIGELTDDTFMQAKGKAKQLEGDVREAAGDLKEKVDG